MSKYAEFFLNSKSSIIQLELIEISHSAFTQTYRVVRNASAGVMVKHEDGSSYSYQYYPLTIVNIGTRENLDFGIRINLGDLGEILPTELENVRAQGKFAEKPIVTYRTYRSDDLDVPLFGPLRLEVRSFAFSRESAQFEAKAPALNVSETGEVYKIDRFPMLRGFL